MGAQFTRGMYDSIELTIACGLVDRIGYLAKNFVDRVDITLVVVDGAESIGD
jgi:hypothetical protein